MNPKSVIYKNEYHQNLYENVKAAIRQSKLYKAVGITATFISGGIMLYSTIGNSDFLPMSNVCFRPDETILTDPFDETGKNKRFCSNGGNILPILRPYYDKLIQRNFDFATKTSIVNEHDDNLDTTRLLLMCSASLGIVGCIAASLGKSNLKASKNAFYQLKHSEFSLNEMTANASKETMSNELDGHFNPQEESLLPNPLSIALNDTTLEHKISENIAKIKEEEKKAAKLEKEINKIKGKVDSTQESITDSHQSESSELSDELNERKDSMIEYLKAHEGGWLWYFIDNQTPLWWIGRPGSGKTWTLAAIALIRKYCLGIQVGYVIDAHGLGVNKEIWDLLEPVEICAINGNNESEKTLSRQNMAAAFGTIINSYTQRIANTSSKTEQVQDVIDEYTNYKEDEIIGDSANKWCRAHMTDSRKAYRWTTAATHNDTKATFPEGTFNQRLDSTNMIKKKSKNGKTPLSNIEVIRGYYNDEGDEVEDFRGHLPTWFTPKVIHGHLTGGEEIDF